MAPGQDLTGVEFAGQFPITTDTSVLPAAGPDGPAGIVASGADFHNPAVDPLFTPAPLPLLPPEALPGIEFGNPEGGPTTTEEIIAPSPPPPHQIEGTVSGIVEEEQLNYETENSFVQGNEDPNDASAPASSSTEDGLDQDTSAPSVTTNTTNVYHSDATTSLANLFTGGTVSIDGTVVGSPVNNSTGSQVTSGGGTHDLVYGQFDNSVAGQTTIEGGYVDGFWHTVFTLTIFSDGSYEFNLLEAIDQPVHSFDDGTNPAGIFEETLYLDLTSLVLDNGSNSSCRRQHFHDGCHR